MPVIRRREPGACSFRETVPASWNSVEEIVRKFRSYYAGGAEGPDRFPAELLLREALTNAVIHGSGGDSRRQIDFAMRLNRRRLLLVIGDEGAGFDWHNRQWRAAEPAACSGRGMEIFHRYATQVRFNAKGNVLILRKKLEQIN